MLEQSDKSLLETAYLLKSSTNAEHLKRSIAQYKQGRASERDLIDDQNRELDKTEALSDSKDETGTY
jgi:hypothetical protein